MEASGGVSTPNPPDPYSKPAVYTEVIDGREVVVYRASSLGFCPGALVRARLGVQPSPPPANIEAAWAMGREHEDALVARGLEMAGMTDVQNRDHLGMYGRVVEHAGSTRLQVETELWCGDGAVVRCHPDGVAIDKGSLDPWVVEAKLLSQSYYDSITKNGLTPTYHWQAGVERASTGLPLLYIVGVKDEEGKWDPETGRVIYWTVQGGPTELDIKMRVWEIEGYVARGEMPDCPLPLMYPCPWWKEHPEPVVEDVEDALLRSLANRYFELGVKIDIAKAARDNARDGILAWYADRGDNDAATVTCHQYKVTRVGGGEKGNVAWKQVAEKYMPEGVDLDEFRGKPNSPSVRVEMKENET